MSGIFKGFKGTLFSAQGVGVILAVVAALVLLRVAGWPDEKIAAEIQSRI